MSETLTKTIVDCSTGEQTIIPLTVEEIAQREIDRATAEKERIEREAAETAQTEAKASALAKLAKLGLTEDEAKAIAG